MDPLQPFAERGPLDSSLRPPALVVVAVWLGLAGGVLLGASSSGTPVYRTLNAVFFASAFAYLVISLFDFWEHFRLEKAATGKWWSMRVLPPGETVNHALTSVVMVGMFVLARPLPPTLEARDWFVVCAPALFLLLGWNDELRYHRRRCAHREDMMHTVAHLAAGVMMCTYLSTRLFIW